MYQQREDVYCIVCLCVINFETCQQTYSLAEVNMSVVKTINELQFDINH